MSGGDAVEIRGKKVRIGPAVQFPRPYRAKPGRLRSRYGHVIALTLATAIVSSAKASDPPKSGNPLWEIPLSALADTTQRPLFSPTRRRAPPVAPPSIVANPSLSPPQPAEPARPQFTLLGTVNGKRKELAVFMDNARNTVRLLVGQEYGGWTLRSAHAGQANFEKEHRIATLLLPRDEPASPLPLEKRDTSTVSANSSAPAVSANASDATPYPGTQRRRGGRSH
jgi:hypothetical protein